MVKVGGSHCQTKQKRTKIWGIYKFGWNMGNMQYVSLA